MSGDDSSDRVTFLCHIVRRKNLKPGDHIYARRFFFDHHGIYTGEGGDRDVIHIAGKPKGSAGVCCTSLSKFKRRSFIYLVSYNDPTTKWKILGTAHTTPSLPADQVLRNAGQCLADPQSWGRYSLLKRNCEHFAYYCKTGQIQNGSRTRLENCGGLTKTLSVNCEELTETFRIQASRTLVRKILGPFISHEEEDEETNCT